MADNKTPWYPWFPRDFRADDPVELMTYEEEGIYRRLLDYQWLNGSIPSDLKNLAMICSKISAKKLAKIWSKISPCFVQATEELGGSSRLVNRRLERVRVELNDYTARKSAAGRAGAEARWADARAMPGQSEGNATAMPRSWPAPATASALAPALKETAAAAEAVGPVQYAIRCVVAVNQGLRQNPEVGSQFNELVPSAQDVHNEWIAAGVPVEVAETVIASRARRFKPRGRDRQPASLSYFTNAVLKEWERHQYGAAGMNGPQPMTEAQRLAQELRGT